ncbi:TetR/AcrR family transcriptional regulator [Levilactobacillus brevis]|uniref:TetR/AcrR family transcriptional regulator n=1 Tax=Levilactobacillus brevis TaxID=1580 RepID=UPI001F19B07B|nr:TetR/AcrR family transcriptional regulator [Levilactobacillus brevis]MCE6010733.1 TetR/AcrR family transcriptional regulator [Levilactobacillus brevis]MCE6011959.1 TetR/AcrR family transcriptional regulator [Levilactobacillus brevis]MCE6014266.1 TetR/AcrR family transcriptional regulator [Levilactobacillus brevis]MCE6016728.1 TetR/AcrR family transcriptional regulator [Levilactobacillus brevis]MCE6019134.1 TetR/AcrR family transcriptional regulator [Levilactobacillus brevis]
MEADAQRLQTEIKLQRAFIKLVGEQGFERVTVRQLTTEAQINRGTFYLHYLDKFDLLTRYENDLVNQVHLIFQQYPKPTATQAGAKDAFSQLFRYLYRQWQLAVILLESPASQLTKRIKPLILEVIGQPKTTLIPAGYARELVAQGVLDFIRFWLTQTPVQSPQQAYTIFTRSRELSPAQLLN